MNKPSFDEQVERATEYAQYIVKNDTTVRDAAKVFGYSKSAIVFTIKKYLKHSGRPDLIEEYKEVAERHFNFKYIKGSQATKLKYAMIRKSSKKKKKIS